MDAQLLHANRKTHIPDWALRQRHLFDVMNVAAPLYQERYTRQDGTFVWREEWPGMDGSDDGYESYHNWPLLYALGGAGELHRRSRFLWEAVTRQFTGYGQIHREFDAYYDWMHHGESSIYFYYFGLADPNWEPDRARALRFAGFYTGDDPTVPNWDAERRMIRSPITGSRGPRFENSWEDWSTHRWVMSGYPIPFDDLDVPTEVKPFYGADVRKADWEQDDVYGEILKTLNARQMRCDVPLNLAATSLITNAFLYTGEDRYRRWVFDYLEAWHDRIEKNDGLCPDNVGPNGIVGETMDGKWWGGYYGWQWPHGFMTIIEPLTIAAMNAALLSGDMGYLDIPRGQLDRILELGREENGQWLVPHRHTDEGWTAYRPLQPKHAAQIWYMSQDARDRQRLDNIPETKTAWLNVAPGRSKGDDLHFGPWYCYLDGRLPDYPRRILEEQYAEVLRRMDAIRNDHGDPESWDVHHWQNMNPVHTEGLVQLTCGGPQVIYHGGLLHTRLRYYDAHKHRPGLPEDVSALVSNLDSDSTTVELFNTSPLHARQLVVQAGAFREHRFTTATELDGENGRDSENTRTVNSTHFHVDLQPGRSIKLRLEMDRYCNTPTYTQPV